MKGGLMIQVAVNPISPPDVLSSLKGSNSGSLIMHVGVVRPLSEGKKVVSIEYQINRKEAEQELSNLASEIQSKWEIDDIALCRRSGQLNFGETILVVAVSAPRHKAAFQACQFAVEQMKNMASVTKREVFSETAMGR
jgi:molybdopterin synthase catalytic subunit